jgi:hypothetical protein
MEPTALLAILLVSIHVVLTSTAKVRPTWDGDAEFEKGAKSGAVLAGGRKFARAPPECLFWFPEMFFRNGDSAGVVRHEANVEAGVTREWSA